MITTTIATTSTISRLSLYYQQNYEYRARQENPEDGIRIATAQKPRTRTMLLVAFDSGGGGGEEAGGGGERGRAAGGDTGKAGGGDGGPGGVLWGGGGGGREEARVGRDRARAASALSCPACNFPAIFPANLPLLVGDETGGEPRLFPSHSLCRRFTRPDVSSVVLVRTRDQNQDPGFPTGARNADIAVSRDRKNSSAFFLLLSLISFRRDTKSNIINVISVLHSQITRLVLIACFSKMVIKFEINLLIRRQYVCEV